MPFGWQFLLLWSIVQSLVMIRDSSFFSYVHFLAQCYTNPCQLNEGQFSPPLYNCLQHPSRPSIVYCTCPDGQIRENGPCRKTFIHQLLSLSLCRSSIGICDTINCGPTGVCIERSFCDGSFYACGCTNSTGNYVSFSPCPGRHSEEIDSN